MIPKIIHYCWFGHGPLPSLALKCIASWKKYLPDYEIKEWNEDNFPLEQYIFAKEALANKKYAFVSDVARLHALKYEGGIYMDTDVEVIKSFNDLLDQSAFSGFENDNFVPTGMMASIKEGDWVSDLLAYYYGKSFIKSDKTFNTTSNTVIITEMMKEKGFKMNNRFQSKEGYVAFYPNEYFCPKSYKTGQTLLTENSYCIHHFAKSWISTRKKWRNILKMKSMQVFGYENMQWIIDKIKK